MQSKQTEVRMRVVVVVDGEHYPPVVAACLGDIRAAGTEVLGGVLAGGREKLPSGGLSSVADTEILAGPDTMAVLDRAIQRWSPDAVVDLSDEPVVDYRRRFALAAVAMHRGVAYQGADFRFQPPPRPKLCELPSMAIAGTGKRTGKTAVAGFAARHLAASGRKPVIVAMGRGGPEEPEVLRGDGIDLRAEDLIAMADKGKHAASDYIEDALLGRVPTVGCRRCGGGIAGGVDHSNVGRGIEIANSLDGDLILLEGSGAALPPAHADVTGLVVPASVPEEYLAGYMGPYRLLLADFAVVTMCEEPFGSPSRVSKIARLLGSAWRGDSRGPHGEEIRVVRTVFRPTPVHSVEGAKVFVATTAPAAVGDSIRDHLEAEHGCKVVGVSHALSDRDRLEQDLEAGMGGADILLCEIKAAGIDVATRRALDGGLDVVYMDNVPVGVTDEDDLEGVLSWAVDLANLRFQEQDGG